MNRVSKNKVRVVLLIVGVGLLAVLSGLVPVRIGFLKSTIADIVSETVGIQLEINGPLTVRLGLRPTVTTSEISLATDPDDSFVAVESLKIRTDLPAFFRNSIHIIELAADELSVNYCVVLPDTRDPESNDSPESTAAPSISIDSIALTGIELNCGSPPESDPWAVRLSEVNASAGTASELKVDASGSVSGIDFEVVLAGGELNDLIARRENYPFSAELESTELSASTSGTLQQSTNGIAVQAQVETNVRNVRDLARELGTDLPELGAMTVRGAVRAERATVDLLDFSGVLGGSSFDFSSSLSLSGEIPQVSLDAVFDVLDIGPFLRGEAGASAASPTADTDYRTAIESLRAFDADARIEVNRVMGTPTDAESVDFSGILSDGRVEIERLAADILGGRISIRGALDGTLDCPELDAIIRAEDIDLATLNSIVQMEASLGGGINALDLESSSCGTSLSGHIESLRSDLELSAARVSLDEQILPLMIERLSLSVEPESASRILVRGGLQGEEVEATITVGSVEDLLGSDTWPIRVDAVAAGSRIKVVGESKSAQPFVDASVEVSVPQVGMLHAFLEIAPEADLPLHVSSQIRLDEARLDIDDIDVSLGETDLGGRLVWDGMTDPELVSLTVRSSLVNLAEIAALVPAQPDREKLSEATVTPEYTEIVLPSIDVDLSIDALHADRIDLQDLEFSARLRDGVIDSARTSVVVENDVRLQGDFALDLRSLPAKARLDVSGENLDIDRVLRRMEIANELRLRADNLQIRVTSDGSSPRELLVNTLLQAELNGFNWIVSMRESDGGEVTQDDFNVDLESVQLAIAPDQLTTWQTNGRIDGADIELWLETPSLEVVLDPSAGLPFTAVAALGNDVMKLDAFWDRSAVDNIAGRIMLSGQVIPGEDRRLSALASPLNDYQIETEVFASDRVLRLPELQMRLGSSTASGNIVVDASAARTRYDIDLRASLLQTDDLLYWSKEVREEMADAEEPEASGDKQGVLGQIREVLTQFSETNDLDLGINIDELRAGEDMLGSGTMKLHVDANQFVLSPLQFRLPGGDVSAEYWVRNNSGQLDAGLNLYAEALRYGGLLRLVDHESEARGVLYLDTELRADTELLPGVAPLELLRRNAEGFIDFAAWPENIEAGVLDMWSANIVLALLPRPSSDRVSKLNCLVVRFDAEDGLMESRTTLLDTTDTIIRGRGKIDLAEDELDLVFWPQAKREKFLSVSTPIAITGPVQDFEVGVEPGGFLVTLTKWYTALIYVPFKWLTGERFEPDGTSTCFDAMDWELTPELHDYFLRRDFSVPPPSQ